MAQDITGTRMTEYYRAVGKQHPQQGMTPEQAGKSFLETKGQESTIGSHAIGNVLSQTGLGAQKMKENAQKDAEDIEAGYHYAEKINGKPKSSNLHSYNDTFQQSQPVDGEMSAAKMMAFFSGGSGASANLLTA